MKKGNEKKWNHAEEQNKPTKISITEGSTRAVPNQHGRAEPPAEKHPVQVTGHGPCSADTPPCPDFCFNSLIFVTGT